MLRTAICWELFYIESCSIAALCWEQLFVESCSMLIAALCMLSAALCLELVYVKSCSMLTAAPFKELLYVESGFFFFPSWRASSIFSGSFSPSVSGRNINTEHGSIGTVSLLRAKDTISSGKWYNLFGQMIQSLWANDTISLGKWYNIFGQMIQSLWTNWYNLFGQIDTISFGK